MKNIFVSKSAMTKLTTLIIVAVLVIAGVVGTVAYLYLRPSGTADIRIGVVMPLSPPGGFVDGSWGVRIIDMLVADINANGGLLGKNVTTIVYDTAGTPDKGISAVDKLIGEDQCIAMFGEYHSSVALAMLNELDKFNVPFVTANCWSDSLTAQHKNYFFRPCFSVSMISEQALAWINAENFTRIAAIFEQTDYGTNSEQLLRETLNNTGVEIDSYFGSMTTTDWTPIITRMQQKTYDLVACFYSGDGRYSMFSQIHDAGIAPTSTCAIYDANGGTASVPVEWWQNEGEAGKYVVFWNTMSGKVQLTTRGEAFKAEFRALWGADAPLDDSLTSTVDAFNVLIDAIKRAGSTDPAAIISALEQTNTAGVTVDSITFGQGAAGDWRYHTIVYKPLFVMQYTEIGQNTDDANVIFPPAYASANYTIPP